MQFGSEESQAGEEGITEMKTDRWGKERRWSTTGQHHQTLEEEKLQLLTFVTVQPFFTVGAPSQNWDYHTCKKLLFFCHLDQRQQWISISVHPTQPIESYFQVSTPKYQSLCLFYDTFLVVCWYFGATWWLSTTSPCSLRKWHQTWHLPLMFLILKGPL